MLALLLLTATISNVISQSLVINLNGINECISFESMETISSIQVGWIKIMSCIEYPNNTFAFEYGSHEIAILAHNAISLRIQPLGGNSSAQYHHYALTALPYTTPIISYLNKVTEISYDGTSGNYTSAKSHNWSGSGSAKRHLSNTCFQGLYDLKYLCVFTKCTNLCSNVDICIKNDYPLVIRYFVASLGTIHLCLSSKTDPSSLEYSDDEEESDED